jgi:hypothetical protein
MRHSSIALNAPIEFINVKPLNPLISKCEIKVCYVGEDPNRNRSIITKEVAKDLANSLPGSPIVGYYNEINEDFEEHNRSLTIKDGRLAMIDDTRPYGFVDLGARVWFQKFLDDGVNEREYLMTEGYLWTGQYPEAKRIIESGNNHSMELDQNIIDAYWTKDVNGKKQFFIINEAIISKLCILGEKEEPCFEGSSITSPKLQFSFEDSFKEQLFSMMNEIKTILSEGGAPMEDNKNIPVVEEPAVEEEVVETPVVEEPAVEEPATAVEEPVVEEPEVPAEEPVADPEPEADADPVEEEVEPAVEPEENPAVQYNLDEIPEYVELSQNYSDLETKYNLLVSDKAELEKSLAELTAFKLAAQRKDKEAMINSFYMLSDEDKKDCFDNIDTYSLDDIEAKLSIICVRNKVSFDLDEEKKDEPTTYNLNSGEIDDDSIPAWIKAVRSVAKDMN